MILGGLLVLANERLLSKWSRAGLNEYKKLGLITGEIVFFALFFDFVLEFAQVKGSSVVLFVIFMLRLRRADHFPAEDFIARDSASFGF